MKKLLSKTLIGAFVMLLSFPITASAGIWQPVGNEWKYQNDDGSYLTNSWLSEQGESYYFSEDGWMIKNTLSPDGLPLGRDGKLLSDHETLPDVYSGTESDYITFFCAFQEFVDGYYSLFNQAYDEIYPIVFTAQNNVEFTNALVSIERLNSFDFSPYIASEHIGVRKAALYSEIFRIEQMYYLRELIRASENQNTQYYSKICDKMDESVSTYANNFIGILHQMEKWDHFS